MRALLNIFMAAALTASLAACGSSSSGGSTGADDSSTTSAQTATYKVEFTPVTAQTDGRSVFTVTVTSKTSGAPVTGLSDFINVWMAMEANHGTPVGSVTDNGDGSYTVVVYYLMASMMNGVRMGTWNVDVTVAGEQATFNPEVTMAMGGTAKATLKNDADMIAGMTGAETRPYYLFKESLTGSTGSHTFKIFLATRESMMVHPAVYSGRSLTDENGASWPVNSVTLQVSTDGGGNWTDMTEEGSGYFSVSGLAGLVDGAEGSIYVRLFINGAQYTTDGSAAAGENAWQVFTVTPGASM